MSNKDTQSFLRQSFALFLGVRLLYWLINTKSVFSFLLDSYRYDKLSNQILQGNFDLDTGNFLAAPFYPWLVAIFKYLFASHSFTCLSFFQIFMECLAGTFLLRLAFLLWDGKKNLYKLLTFLYAFYPLTFWYCYALGQESLFQSFLIISLFFYVKTCINYKNKNDLMAFSVLFCLCFLTKAHILVFVPFILLGWYRQSKSAVEKVEKTFIFTFIVVLMTLPNGLFNLQKHQTYTISSDGSMFFFWYGNSGYAYRVYAPEYIFEESKDSAFALFAEGERFRDDESAVSKQRFSQLPSYPVRHQLFRDSAINWIKREPYNWLALKKKQALHFIIPGVTSPPYPFSTWLAILSLSLPIYLLAYWGFFSAYKKERIKHFWMMDLYLFMTCFSIFFGLQNRFRVITLEPFLLLYAAYSLSLLQDYFLSQKIK